ncbi:MAG: hypothetical protein ACYCWE_06075 [Eubacteriales bacterium]
MMSKKNILSSAILAKNNYCNFLDENMNYIPYFYLFTNPETFGVHCEWDFGDATGRYLDALLLCCEISGFDEVSVSAAKKLKNALAGMISPEDGLCYRPKGYEWVSYGANSFDQRSCLLGLATWYKYYRDNETAQLCENLIKGLYKMGRELDDYFYIPVESYTDTIDKKTFEPVEFDFNTYGADQCHYGGGVIIYPLMYWYRLSGSKEALRLAGKLSRFILFHSCVFADDGSFWMTGSGVDADGHFHSRMDSIAGILEYAIETEDKSMISRCRKIYDWAVTQGTEYGLFPEGFGRKIVTGQKEEYPDVSKHSEICCTTDMIETALLLGKNINSGYLDHADKYLNHLLACQLDDISWISPSPEKEDTDTATYRNAAERYRGAFTGRTTPNDLTNFGRYDNMGCCAAAGGRGLYMLWDSAAVYKDESLEIDLWLDADNGRASISHDEARGVIIFTPAQRSDILKIRLPSWLSDKKDSIKAAVLDNCQTDIRKPIFDGNYMLFSEIPSGASVRVSYPVEETEDVFMFCGEEYRTYWKGNKVIEVLPKGAYIPLYVRGE